MKRIYAGTAAVAISLFVFPAFLSSNSAEAALPSSIQETVANGCDAGAPPEVYNPYDEIVWAAIPGDYLIYKIGTEDEIVYDVYYVIMGYSSDYSSVLVYEYNTYVSYGKPTCSWRPYDGVYVNSMNGIGGQTMPPLILPIRADGEDFHVAYTDSFVAQREGYLSYERDNWRFYSIPAGSGGGGTVYSGNNVIYVPDSSSSHTIELHKYNGIWTATKYHSDTGYANTNTVMFLDETGHVYVPPIDAAEESTQPIQGTYSIGEKYAEICVTDMCFSGVRFNTSFGDELDLSLETTSTVDRFILYEENAALYFEVNGDSEAEVQSAKFTIGNVLVGDYIVLVDGDEAEDYEITQDPETGETIMVVKHPPGKHEIRVDGVRVVPEFPVALVAVAIGIAAMIAVTSKGRLCL